MQAKARLGNPVLWPLAALLIVALLLVGLTSSASAGSDGKGTASTSKKKCKKKSKGSSKSSAKRKRCHRHKHKPGSGRAAPPQGKTPPPATTPQASATLAINPPGFNFGTAEHGGFGGCGADPDPNCPTQAFTVTNTGGSTSGTPTALITETHNPEIGGVAAFQITSNTCTAALAPGTSCSLTVKFAPNSNAGDGMYSSRLDVTGAPGGTATSLLSGLAG